jgi:putative nucleotidyltransferase with HDIG domain
MEALPAQPSERLVWATLLHDIGKPPTLTHPIGANDRIRFSRHYAVGAEMALGLLRRFNFSKKMTADICWMIEHHINIDDVPHMRAGHQRAMLDHPAFEDLLALHRADAMATWPPSGPHTKPVVFPELDALWHQHRTITSKSPRPNLKRDIGIDGHWLRQMFPDQLEQLDSAHIGKILDKLNNAYENEGMTQKQEIHQCAHQLIVDAIAEKITQANQ